VELDDIRDGKQLWGRQYTRKVADLLATETDIAGAVSERLRAQLAEADRAELLARGLASNPEAYQLYLKGKYHTSKFTNDRAYKTRRIGSRQLTLFEADVTVWDFA
jgi:adenylate cyclase